MESAKRVAQTAYLTTRYPSAWPDWYAVQDRQPQGPHGVRLLIRLNISQQQQSHNNHTAASNTSRPAHQPTPPNHRTDHHPERHWNSNTQSSNSIPNNQRHSTPPPLLVTLLILHILNMHGSKDDQTDHGSPSIPLYFHNPFRSNSDFQTPQVV